MKEPITYPSKIDIWASGIFVATPLLVIALGITIVMAIGIVGWFVIGGGFLIGFLMYTLSFPCNYTMSDDQILIRNGINEEKIKIKDIRRCFCTTNAMAAPALSLKRIEIDTKEKTYLISPKDRDGFIHELNKKVPSANKAVRVNSFPRVARSESTT